MIVRRAPPATGLLAPSETVRHVPLAIVPPVPSTTVPTGTVKRPAAVPPAVGSAIAEASSDLPTAAPAAPAEVRVEPIAALAAPVAIPAGSAAAQPAGRRVIARLPAPVPNLRMRHERDLPPAQIQTRRGH